MPRFDQTSFAGNHSHAEGLIKRITEWYSMQSPTAYYSLSEIAVGISAGSAGTVTEGQVRYIKNKYSAFLFADKKHGSNKRYRINPLYAGDT